MTTKPTFIGGLMMSAMLVATLWCGCARGDEIQFSSKEYAKLDTFEAIAIEDADKLYNKKDYQGAYAAYRAYTTEFDKGRALPYALLRMGRCQHMDGKRNAAIKAYQDVVDYFPKANKYAAAALYYIGECQAQNGDKAKSLATWAKMVMNDAYAREPNSGTALTALASAMQEQGDFEQATTYRWKTAVAFRDSNPKAADEARDSVVAFYVVHSPDQANLLEFCNEVEGFGWRGHLDKPENSATYWQHVFRVLLGSKIDANQKADACQYWAQQMGDRFADSDELRVDWFNAQLAYEKDADKWYGRMKQQFTRQPVTLDRVEKWLHFFGDRDKYQSDFYKTYGQPLVAGLTNDQKLDLVRFLSGRIRMDDQAVSVLGTIGTDGLKDAAICDLAGYEARYKGEDAFLRTVAKINNPTLAARTRFDFYYGQARRDGASRQKSLAQVPVLAKSPDQVQYVTWAHAELLRWDGQYEEAIKLYRKSNRQPDSTWAVIDCMVALKQYDQAIRVAGELETVGGTIASSACLRAADIYKISGNKAKEIEQLQLVLRRYPKSAQSSFAHERLENYGVKLIGGESQARD